MSHDEDLVRAHLFATPLSALLAEARASREAGHALMQSFSPKMFIALTQLCRDYCHYCTFSWPQARGAAAYLTRGEVVVIARAGAAQGCTEALFTLGDKPEPRHPAARVPLDAMGYASTVDHLAAMCAAVLAETGLLIGIGDTREERLDALFALAGLHARYGHIQEVIVQNFRAKPRTPMADAPKPDLDDFLWTIAAARLILGPEMSIQAPPNLSADDFPQLMEAGINDWCGVSPATPDHVNPEAPWPELARLEAGTRGGNVTVGGPRAGAALAGLSGHDRGLRTLVRSGGHARAAPPRRRAWLGA